MYSQYSYYQNNNPSSSTNNNMTQQQQPQTTTSSTSNQVWNGQQWVPVAATTTTTITQQQPVQPVSYYAQVATTSNPNPIIKHGKTHAELVQRYTDYYHQWQQQSAIAQNALSSLPPPHPATPSNNTQRDEMERRDKWAIYYAGNSAALAHYHLNASKSNGVVSGDRPPSPPMPPQMQNVVQAAAPVEATPAVASVAVSPKKKSSRWSTSTSSTQQQQSQNQSQQLQQQGDTNYYGKSTTFNNTANTSLLNLEAHAVQQRGGRQGNATSQQQQVGNTSSLLYSNFTRKDDDFNQYTNPNNRGIGVGGDGGSRVGGMGGMKRKFQEEEVGANYYGPSKSPATNITSFKKKTSSYEEDDYVPLGLNQPLGGGVSLPTKLSKKERKRQKKMAALLAKKQSSSSLNGFNTNDSTLSERANRFKGRGGLHSASSTPSTIDNVERYMGKTTIGGSMKKLNDVDYERMTVKGTCTTLEKEYLRLTSPPKAELVRPQYILQQHLLNLKQSYYVNNKVHNGRNRDYSWYCSQLKAIRQDLTVQRIINAFSVDVYETHAKMALEEDDINEYNQSQTQLKELYDAIERQQSGSSGKQVMKLKSKNKAKINKEDDALKNQNEFVAYRIIYYVFLSQNKKYEGGSSDIFKIMLQLTPEQRRDGCVHHALLVRSAVAESDYHKFFQLQDSAPNMGDYLMDKIVPSIRQGALQRICKAYKPSVSSDFVLKELGFDVQNTEEVEGGKAWMESCGCKFEGGLLLTKDAILKESVGSVKNSLI